MQTLEEGQSGGDAPHRPFEKTAVFADITEVRNTFRQWFSSPRFEVFYLKNRREFARNSRFNYPKCRDEDIEDAWQGALLDIHYKTDNFKVTPNEVRDAAAFEARLAPYVKRAAQFKLISALRKSGKVTASLDELTEDQDKLDKLLFELDAYVRGPEQAIEALSRRDIIMQCLAKLTELARETFTLALSGLKDTEIQKLTNSGSAVSVRRRISETKIRVVDCVRTTLRERV